MVLLHKFHIFLWPCWVVLAFHRATESRGHAEWCLLFTELLSPVAMLSGACYSQSYWVMWPCWVVLAIHRATESCGNAEWCLLFTELLSPCLGRSFGYRKLTVIIILIAVLSLNYFSEIFVIYVFFTYTFGRKPYLLMNQPFDILFILNDSINCF